MMNHFISCRRYQDSDESDKLSFVASTDGADRYGDIIDQRGWDLSSYEKNPVVLLNHDSSSLPIGKGKVALKNNQLVIDVVFDMEDPRAAEIARKAKAGFLNAVSVGFQPTESKQRSELNKDNPYYGKRGQFFSKAELLEISIVTIPANGDAVAMNYKQLQTMKTELAQEMKEIIRGEIAALPDLKLRHIEEIIEEEDRIIISFAKYKEEEEIEEEEETEELEENEAEEEELAYDEEEELNKNLINQMAAILAANI
jgi:HK97 family phage prohead protease